MSNKGSHASGIAEEKEDGWESVERQRAKRGTKSENGSSATKKEQNNNITASEELWLGYRECAPVK